jgi:hypothetical protein
MPKSLTFSTHVILFIRRLRTIAVETFKIIHKQNPSYLHDLISIKDQKYNFRTAVLPRERTTRYGLNSFRYNAATNILNKNIHQFMQFNLDTSYRSRYQLNKSKLKIRGSCI